MYVGLYRETNYIPIIFIIVHNTDGKNKPWYVCKYQENLNFWSRYQYNKKSVC